MNFDDLDPVDVKLDINGTIRRLMDVAKVALADEMPEPSERELLLLLRVLLATVARAMPTDLQEQDVRVQQARALLEICERLFAEKDP